MKPLSFDDKVLFVDDEEHILQSIRRGLINEPYKQFYVSSAREALEILEKEDIAVLVTDMRMPEMNGLELLQIVREKYPDTVRIVLTAYTQVATILSAINSGQIYRYLTKPWRLEEEFIPTIRQSIEYHKLVVERREMVEKLREQNKKLSRINKELLRLKTKAEQANRVKTEILNELVSEIIPYVVDVIQTTYELSLLENPEIREISKDLSERGSTILESLREVERKLRTQF